MSQLYLSGSDEQGSGLELMLQDCLAMMGEGAITAEQGSLAWCEAYAYATALMAAINFVQLMSNQLTPDSLSIFADRFADIYNLPKRGTNLIPDNLNEIKEYVAIKTAIFGTPCNYSNVKTYIESVLGPLFIGLEYVDPKLQSIATQGPPSGAWVSPLSSLLVRVWQPRDNKDNYSVDINTFQTQNNKYAALVQSWMPAYIAVRNLNLIYSGANSLPNYNGGVNVVSIAAGDNLLTGVGTKFLTDFANVSNGYMMPIEIVDDNNNLNTFHVKQLVNDTVMRLYETVPVSITNRTYRCLGIQMDVPYVLDNACFN